jgi:glycosyltransferase involved in cell wall biosynthesis
VIIVLTVSHGLFQQSESPSPAENEDGPRPPHFMGASVSGLRQLEALAAAPFVDRLIAYAPPGVRPAAAEAVKASPFAGRVEIQDEEEIRTGLEPHDKVVLVNFGPDLVKPQALRWASGNRRWPICGFTYSIATSGIFQSVVLSALSGFQPYDSIFCCSTCIRGSMERVLDAIAERVPGLAQPLLPVVPLGIRAADFRPIPKAEARRALSLPDGAVVFLYLGRIDPRYKANLQPLLHAFGRLGKTSDALLVVAGARPDSGGGEILDRLRFRSVELGIADRVRWHTDVSAEVRRTLLSAADVFVSPVDNLQESFGIAVVEAMCAGLPVVASDWDGYRDIVAHEETGLLVPTRLPEDLSGLSQNAGLASELDFHWEVAEATVVDVPALERAMTRLAGDPALRAEMGRRALERATALFDWEVVLQRSREEWEAQLEMARRTVEPLPSPLLLNHGDVFGLHPTERLDARVRIRRTAEALLPSIVVSLPPPFLNGALLQQIIDSTEEAVALDQLPGDPPATVRHAAYLLKHGLLERVD